MADHGAQFKQSAKETTMRGVARLTILGVGLVASMALGGCAAIVNDHGTNGTPYTHIDGAIGVQGKTSQAIVDGTKNIPIIGQAMQNVFGGREMSVDQEGRTVLDVPTQPSSTTFCGWMKTDCPDIPPPSNSGLYYRDTPDKVGVVCPTGSKSTVLDPPSKQKTSLFICREGTGAQARYVAPAIIVNSKEYSPVCPARTVGALKVDAIKAGDYQGAGTCLTY